MGCAGPTVTFDLGAPLVGVPGHGKNMALRKELAKAIDRGDEIVIVDGKTGEWPA